MGRGSRRAKKKRSRRNIILNILSVILLLVALALIFNSSIRNMIMVWHTNKMCIRDRLIPRLKKSAQQTSLESQLIMSL